ncbi:hypothetical protein Tco_1469704, partial [Tanacetum coccineum]
EQIIIVKLKRMKDGLMKLSLWESTMMASVI